MRQVASVTGHRTVARLILYATEDGVYVFPCASHQDGSAIGDEWYETVEDAEAACLSTYGVALEAWTGVEDPLPECQHDWIAPVRVVGRSDGLPQWGRFERLEDGRWVEIEQIDGTWRTRPTGD